jgi:DNA-binding transcriptional regulator GbsR (MarR family)
MEDYLNNAKETLIQELGRLSSFAGFNKLIGQIYGLLYLGSEPVSLGEIAEQLAISKGNASLNIRQMERWGLIHPISKKGDRRDYYQAETDFWKIFRGIISERDKKEIDHTLNAIKSINNSIGETGSTAEDPEYGLYRERLQSMLEFGNAANQMVQAFLAMDNFLANSLMRSGMEKSQSQYIQVEE